LRRIAKEKKQSYIKGKLIQDMPFDAFEVQDTDEDRAFHNAYLEFMQNNQNFDDFIERKKEKKKKKQPSLDDFLGDENGESDTGLIE
jgi:predicted RNA-binding protein with PIN domain